MITRKHLWLDLEDTVIAPVMEGWWKTELIDANVRKIRRIIATFQPDVVNIFSFAIHDELQLVGFNAGTRPMIEAAIGKQLSTVLTVDEQIIPMCCGVMGLTPSTVDFQEMSNFWSKHEAFRLCMRHITKNLWVNWQQETEVVLLDDAVFNESFKWPDLHVTGHIMNIDTIFT
jgi:hypothetical protein